MSSQSYTPTINSHSVSVGLIKGAKRSLDLEIPLFETHSERETCESVAELYSIIVAINALEKGYIKDEFVHDEDYYTNTTTRFIRQFNLILEDDEVNRQFGDLDSFVKKFHLDCPLAVKRIQIGTPATIEQPKDNNKEQDTSEGKNTSTKEPIPPQSTGTSGTQAKAVAEATGAFITLMDAIKLNYNTKEQLHPLLSDIVTTTNGIFKDYDGRSKLVEWLIRLNKLKFEDTLSEDDLKEFLWDVDSAYKGFFAKLQ